MTRNTDSKLYNDILLSADPLDSMKQYSRKYINSHVQAEGRAMIEILKQTASMSDPTGTTEMTKGKCLLFTVSSLTTLKITGQ